MTDDVSRADQDRSVEWALLCQQMDMVVVDKQDPVEDTVFPHEVFCRGDVFGFVFVVVFLSPSGFLLRQGQRTEEPGADERGVTKKISASGTRFEHDFLLLFQADTSWT